ncbi:F-actin-capping protein subunit alpha [Zostera marina]|uniref:F-actin-capping protein subunit alpha n=1 Tax=Zostera marina TaxID=29655 RepID=A0A0K9NY44_ZOSMR|nr:F-actin-capping protein subunit alpha [Zostera marina]
MAEEDETDEPEALGNDQKKEIANWFLTNAPSGEIQYIAKDVKSILMDDQLYDEVAAEAFPFYNKSHLLALKMPNRSTDVLITTFGELNDNNYLDPRTAQVVTVNHIKQVCTNVRPATEEELPSQYIEEFRGALDSEICKYVVEAYHNGVSAVYCIDGKDVEELHTEFKFVVVISAARHSPHNFCNGSWRSVWNLEFSDDHQKVELMGNIQVGAHYFEEGNVQLDSKNSFKNSAMFEFPEDCAVSIANMIRLHENEYMANLEASYSNLPDTTFKDLRRKLPVTRTLFPWHNTLQFGLTRDIANQLGIGK